MGEPNVTENRRRRREGGGDDRVGEEVRGRARVSGRMLLVI